MKQFGFYLTIYLLLMLTLGFGYPLAQRYAQPIASLVFPINPDTSLLRNLVVVSVMYWGIAVLVSMAAGKIAKGRAGEICWISPDGGIFKYLFLFNNKYLCHMVCCF